MRQPRGGRQQRHPRCRQVREQVRPHGPPRCLLHSHTARLGQVRQQATGGSVRGVDRAQEAPLVGEELAYGGGAQLREEGAAVDGAEVGEEAVVVETLGYDGEAGRL